MRNSETVEYSGIESHKHWSLMHFGALFIAFQIISIRFKVSFVYLVIYLFFYYYFFSLIGCCAAVARSFEQSSGAAAAAAACSRGDWKAEHAPNSSCCCTRANIHTTSTSTGPLTACCTSSVLPAGTRYTHIQLRKTHAGTLFDSPVATQWSIPACVCVCVQGRTATTVTSWSNQTPTALPSVPHQLVPAADPQVQTDRAVPALLTLTYTDSTYRMSNALGKLNLQTAHF